ncbi:MAG: RHS repeat-associated core domain-containing protein, partial [Actinomycetota bacterium]
RRKLSKKVDSGHRGYTGQVRDTTRLAYYNARYYDPGTGQFTQPDTIVPDPTEGIDYNRYAYVRNNPINYTDPSGHCSQFTEWSSGDGGTCEFYGSDWSLRLDVDEGGAVSGSCRATGGAVSAGSCDLSPGASGGGGSDGGVLTFESEICPVFGCIGLRFSSNGSVTIEPAIGLAVGITPAEISYSDSAPEPGIEEQPFVTSLTGSAGPFSLVGSCIVERNHGEQRSCGVEAGAGVGPFGVSVSCSTQSNGCEPDFALTPGDVSSGDGNDLGGKRFGLGLSLEMVKRWSITLG